MAAPARTALPKLGASAPTGPVVLDTNVFINALAGRGPPVLRDLLAALPRAFVAAPTRAELAWVQGRLDTAHDDGGFSERVQGRLDPAHPGTARVLAAYSGLLTRIDPAKVLVPDDADWLAAGELAGRAARAASGSGRAIATAFDRVELVSDALTAVLARDAGLTVVTEDADFSLMARLLPGLQVLLYDRLPP